MISRSSFVTGCFVFLIAASLPAGAYSSASTSGSTARASLENVDDPYKRDCLDLAEDLENTVMNVSKQEATNLRTDSATVASAGNGTTAEADLIEIRSEEMHTDQTCFVRPWKANETMMIELTGVEFENTSLRGPWTDVEFEHGEADLMILVLPGDEFLKTLKQSERGRLIFPSMKRYFELSSNVSLEAAETGTAAAADESVGSAADTTSSTDPSDETAPDDPSDNETAPGDPSDDETAPEEENRTETNTTNGSEANATGAIETVPGPSREANDSEAEPPETDLIPRSLATTVVAPVAIGSRRIGTTTDTVADGRRDRSGD